MSKTNKQNKKKKHLLVTGIKPIFNSESLSLQTTPSYNNLTIFFVKTKTLP